MATDVTANDFIAQSSDVLAEDEAALQSAYAQAVTELNRIREKASVDDSASTDHPDYSMHEVNQVGRYVIPRRTGWKALIDIIHDPVANIDFSANVYPAFDGIIGDHFQSPHLLDPLDDQYEAKKLFSRHPFRSPYEDLRDNLAAVRNFLMETYYANTPAGMTPDKARKSLAEIAAFVGDGLYNNWLFLNFIPNHNPTKPFIDLTKAQAPYGKGAQYIYEKILEHQRHSNWTRPFDAVVAFFGGKPLEDWKLPSADATHFLEQDGRDLIGEEREALAVSEQEVAERVAQLEAQLSSVKDARALQGVAVDLDAIGNHLLYTADNMEMEGVAHISEPVRMSAVAIARDILRKLKLAIGDMNIVDGLKMKPSDDMATLGAIKGVAMVYERLLAWARGNGDSEIFQHPAILAATQAIGQMGYLAKSEAWRMATYAGNTVMAANIHEQMKRVPGIYRTTGDTRFGSLLDKIEQGIDTIINRTQEVSVNGVKVGHSIDSNMGATLSAAPTAGMGKQVNVGEGAQRNAQVAAADQLAAQAQAQQINAQVAAAARRQQQQTSQAAPQQPQRSGSARTALRAARNQQQQIRTATGSTTATPPPGANLTAAQQQALRSASASRAAHAAQREEELHHEAMMKQAQLREIQLRANKAIQDAARRIPMDTIKGFDMKDVKGAPVMPGRDLKAMVSVNKPTKPEVKPSAPAADNKSVVSVATDDPNKYPPQPPTPTQPRGPGIRRF